MGNLNDILLHAVPIIRHVQSESPIFWEWIKEVGSRAELRGTLVRAIAISKAYIYLWYVHVPIAIATEVRALT